MRLGVSSREEPTPCCRLPGQHGTIHTPQARSFTNRKRRKSSRPIYDAVSSLEEHKEDDKLTLLACKVITECYWAEYFGDTHVEAHHTSICVPLNGIQVKTSQVIDSFFLRKQENRRGYSGLASLTLRRYGLSSC